MTNPVASLAALLRAQPDFQSYETLAEWLLARGVQYAPRESLDVEQLNRSTETLLALAKNLPKAPPREPPPGLTLSKPCPRCGGTEYLCADCLGARGRPEGPSAPPLTEGALMDLAEEYLALPVSITDAYYRTPTDWVRGFVVWWGSRTPEGT